MNNTNHTQGRQRPAPTFMQHQNTAENKPLQEVAAPVQADAGVQVHEGAPKADADYSLSVDDVRRLLHERGVNKSKDTIQRYCREGDLECRKLGMLKRFYATDVSVQNLLEKMQADAPASSGMQVHEAVEPEVNSEATTEQAKNKSVEKVSETELHETASNGMQVHEGAYSKTIKILHSQLEEKDKQLNRKDTQIDGLLKQIELSQNLNHRIQGTFQTSVLALGGKTMEGENVEKNENKEGQGGDTINQ